MNSTAGMATLVIVTVTFHIVIAVAGTNLKITLSPSQLLTLYRAPSTFRRDARGQLHPSTIIRAERPGQHNIQTPAVHQPTPSVADESHRDARAQQVYNNQVFKPIVVTSRPFGFGSLNNEIHKHQSPTTSTSTTTTTTTTQNPLFDGKGQPTIPFFSISCTFGTSCSQIIAARQYKTPKPTFRPYTKEEIEKGKGSLLAMFPPNLRNMTTSTTARPRTTASSTTSPSPTTARTTTTTTTTKPPTTRFRIRTTTAPTKRPYPAYIRSTTTTTAAPPVTKSTTKYPDLWSQWKWPSYSHSVTSEKSIDRFYVQYTTHNPITTTKASGLSTWTLPESSSTATPSTTTVKSTTVKSNTAYQGHWLSLLSATLNGLQKNQKKPTSASSVLKPSVPSPVLPPAVKQATALPAISTRPVLPSASKQTAVPIAIYRPASSPPVRPVVPSVAAIPHDFASSSAEWSEEKQNSLAWKPESADQQGIITIRQPAVVNTHEIVSTKGNKISLITGAKRPMATAAPSYAAYPLPPEVSISSQMIGLKVKPKSLQHPPNTETVQGVQIETDGQDVNLSHLIMRQNIPRPARYLTALNSPTGRGFQTPSARHLDGSHWQPARY